MKCWASIRKYWHGLPVDAASSAGLLKQEITLNKYLIDHSPTGAFQDQ